MSKVAGASARSIVGGRSLGLVVLGAALAAAPAVRAQDLNAPAETTDQRTTAIADKQVALEDQNLGRLHGMYDLARGVVGKQHVLVSPVVFAGHRCGTGSSVYNCSTPVENHGGVAGVVIMPLFGFGGNHGAEFWPRVQTDTVGDGFRQFDRSYRRLRDASGPLLGLPSTKDASDTALGARFQTRSQAFDGQLARLLDNEAHAYYYDDIKRLRACLKTLIDAPVIPTGASIPTSAEPAASCGEGIAHGGNALGWEVRQKLTYLDDLWSEYDLLVGENPISRHNLLIGPLTGVSITDDFGDILYGGGLELGWKDWLRITASTGFRSSMRGKVKYLTFDDVGWWFGVGLSGQLGDELIDSILGVHKLFASATGGDQ